MRWTWLDDRPLVVAIAGPNGAGKTTFYQAHVAPSGLRLVNADRIAKELAIDAYSAASIAGAIRRELVSAGESFAFETVLSDPVGEKLAFLKACADEGYTVALLFIGLANPALCAQRVAMRVSQGGHDVPAAKLRSRFPRTLRNLKSATSKLPHVIVFDNSDLARPYRLICAFEHGVAVSKSQPLPAWFRQLRCGR
jgi:predicted ABC-type ATPase